MARRILFVSPGTDLGGGEFSLLTLISNLDRGRFEPVVLVYGKGRFLDRVESVGCPVLVRTYRGPFSQAAFILRLARLILRERVALVHVNTLDIRAGIAARLCGVPLVGHLRVIFPITWVDRLFVGLAARTITVSNAVLGYFCRTAGCHTSRCVTVYNAVDVGEGIDSARSLRSELGLRPETQLVGSVGRIDPWKGVDVFVRAASRIRTQHPDVRFIVAGSPGPRDEEIAYDRDLRKLAAELGLDNAITFLGFRDDALEVIAQLDVLSVPSIILKTSDGIHTEGFGRTAAEGLAVGTPVVASQVGGLPEIIQDRRTGITVPPGDDGALAAAVCSLLEDTALGSELTRAGRARFHDCFSVDSHLGAVQSLYDTILDGKPNADRD